MDNPLNRAILCLGSNLDKEKNIERAAGRLRALFVSIRFAEPTYTAAIDCPVSATFLNQVAVAYSPRSADEIKAELKKIECSLGRRPEDKGLGSVPVDIDLLCWNEKVLKPEDMRRDYIQSGIHLLIPGY